MWYCESAEAVINIYCLFSSLRGIFALLNFRTVLLPNPNLTEYVIEWIFQQNTHTMPAIKLLTF